MSSNSPENWLQYGVIILHGDDELAMERIVRECQEQTAAGGDAQLNTTVLDCEKARDMELVSALQALPFFTAHNLVVLKNPLARIKGEAAQKRLTGLLDAKPECTLVVLMVEDTYKFREQAFALLNARHWLVKWAAASAVVARLVGCSLPDPRSMPGWILEEAKRQGGAIQPAAAAAMSDRVGNNTRQASLEIEKCLLYADFKREVTRADVEKLCHTRASANIFKMIDLSAQGDSRQAVELLHRLLEEDDPQSVFGMFVRQFRLLLQTREIMDEGGQAADVTRELRILGFVSGRLMAQAQRYSLPRLEGIYRQLMEIDLANKSSQMDLDLALDLFVASLAK